MKEIVRDNWNFILYEKDEELIIEVVCGTVASFSRTHTLTKPEREQYRANGLPYLKTLAESVRRETGS